MPGREREAAGGRLDGPRNHDDGLRRAGRRRARRATGGGSRPGPVQDRARSCAGSPSCRRSRAARASRHAPGPRGSAPGSSCRAQRGRGRRPCAPAQRAVAPAASARRPRSPGAQDPQPSGVSRPAARLVSRRHPSFSSPSLHLAGPAAGPASRRSTGARIRPIERPDVAARLELVDDARRPRVADLQPPLEQRRRGTIVLLDDLDGIGQQAVGLLVGLVLDVARRCPRRSR